MTKLDEALSVVAGLSRAEKVRVLGCFLIIGSLPHATANLYGQGRIAIDEPVLVSGDRSTIPHVEPHLAAHPSDPTILLGAAVTWPESDSSQGLDASIISGFRSSDGGQSWTRIELPGCRIDPWVHFGGGEQVFLSCLGEGESRVPVVVYRSVDSGENWEGPTPIPAGGGGSTDRPVLAVGREGEASEEFAYVAFGQGFAAAGLEGMLYGPAISRSEDGGESFAPPVFLRHDNLDQQPFDAAVLSDGTLVVVFMDYATSEPRLLAHRRTWLTRSQDGGRTLSTPALVFEQIDREMPWSLAVNRSSRHLDRIYVVADGFWRREGIYAGDLGPRGRADLFVIASDDRGESWSAPVAVTDSPPGTNHETPAIAVNDDGVVGVAWYDARHDPDGGCFDLYFSASVDGGETFLPNVRVTPESSCPRAIERQRGVAERWKFGGDYSGLAAGADGRFHLFWADSRRGVYQIWSASAVVIRADREP